MRGPRPSRRRAGGRGAHQGHQLPDRLLEGLSDHVPGVLLDVVPGPRANHRPTSSPTSSLAGAPAAVGRESIQQSREFPLHLDHRPRLLQFRAQLNVLPSQPGVVAFARTGGRRTRNTAQRLQSAFITLLTPCGDQRGIRAVPAIQRARAGTVSYLVFGQHLVLVSPGVGPPPGTLGHLRVGYLRCVVHRTSVARAEMSCHDCRHRGELLPRPPRH